VLQESPISRFSSPTILDGCLHIAVDAARRHSTFDCVAPPSCCLKITVAGSGVKRTTRGHLCRLVGLRHREGSRNWFKCAVPTQLTAKLRKYRLWHALGGFRREKAPGCRLRRMDRVARTADLFLLYRPSIRSNRCQGGNSLPWCAIPCPSLGWSAPRSLGMPQESEGRLRMPAGSPAQPWNLGEAPSPPWRGEGLRDSCCRWWKANLLRLCDGRCSVNEIVRQLSARLPEVQKSLRDYVCMRLLQGAENEQFIEVYRTARDSVAPNRRAAVKLSARNGRLTRPTRSTRGAPSTHSVLLKDLLPAKRPHNYYSASPHPVGSVCAMSTPTMRTLLRG
jgi:hypothetical protein